MWRQIVDFPMYEINEFGVIRNRNSHYVTTQRMNSSGYLYVQLIKENKNYIRLVHRLVAETFIPNPYNLPIVNHIDECSVHNSADNLEWVSYKDNSNHGTRNERIIKDRKIPVLAFDESGNTIGRYESKREAARCFQVSEISIRSAIDNSNKCCGFYWRPDTSSELNDNEYETNINWITNAKVKHLAKSNRRGKIPVEAYSSENLDVIQFSSQKEAAIAFKVSSTAIATAIKKHTKCCSYYWREISTIGEKNNES